MVAHPGLNWRPNISPLLADPFSGSLGAQNVIISKLAQYELTMKISSQSVHNFSRTRWNYSAIVYHDCTRAVVMYKALTNLTYSDDDIESHCYQQCKPALTSNLYHICINSRDF